MSEAVVVDIDVDIDVDKDVDGDVDGDGDLAVDARLRSATFESPSPPTSSIALTPTSKPTTQQRTRRIEAERAARGFAGEP